MSLAFSCASRDRLHPARPPTWRHAMLSADGPTASVPPEAGFRFVMIKPTHYDDDGYPDPMVPLGDPVQHAGLPQRPCRGRAPAQGAGRRTSTSACTPTTRPTAASARTRIIRAIRRDRRPGADRPRRRAVEPVPARRRPGAALPRGRPAGLHRRLPRLRLLAMLPEMPRRACARRRRWASASSPARPRRAASTRCCATPGTAR